MKQNSIFKEISSMITAKEICRPFAGTYALDTNPELLFESLFESASEKESNPLDEIILITKENQIVGYMGLEDISDDNNSFDVEPISVMNVISSNATLYDLAKAFYYSDKSLLIVLDGYSYIGFIFFSDLKSTYFQMSLLAMILNCEKLILNFIKDYIYLLPTILKPGRYDKTLELYKLKGYKYKDNGEPFLDKLLDCTTFIDRFNIAQSLTKENSQVRSLKNKKFINLSESLRNNIAHPASENLVLHKLKQAELGQFILWAEELEEEMISLIAKK